MNRSLVTLIALVGGVLPGNAQRRDGCGQTGFHFPTATFEQSLKDSGYLLTRESLLSALADPMPDVRSMAAEKIGESGRIEAIPAMMRAFAAERDECTKGNIKFAMHILGVGATWDPNQHPGGQPLVSPFRRCTPSDPPVLSVTLGPTADRNYMSPVYDKPAVRISVRNLTPKRSRSSEGHRLPTSTR